MLFPTGPKRVGVYQNEHGWWVFSCPQRFCYKHIADPNEQTIRQIEVDHGCPNSMGETSYAWSVQVQHLNKMWEELDATLDLIMSYKEIALGEPDLDQIKKMVDAQAYARGLAFALAIWMPPHYTTPEEVAREAVRRRKARLEGDTKYVTGGLHRRYVAGTEPIKRAPAKAIETDWIEQAASKVSEKDRAAIKGATSMFTAEELAKVYQMDKKVIEFILKS